MIKLLRITSLLFLAVIAIQAQAQNTVQGKVTSADDGEALPGVNILVEGTTQGAVTDIDGNYTIQVGDGETLVYSFIGFTSVKEAVSGRSIINVVLQSDVSELQEVVVVGYGTQEERDLTSAISTLDAEELTKTPTSQAMQALQGKVAGVQIVNSGAPGAAPTVRVRGVGSFEGDASPLYVVDGMFFDNIDFLNPNDIQSLSVLKDASASAIYGVRAANGVVVITTKSGDYDQKPQIVYDGYYGIQVPQNVIKMANTEQYVNYVNETGSATDIGFVNNAFQQYGRSRINPNVPDVNTDWYSEIMSPATIQNHSLSFNGGSEKTRYSISGGYFNQEGLLNDLARDEYKRMNLRAKIDTKVNDWLTVGANLNTTISRQYVGEGGAWFQSYFAVPILPVYDENNTDASPYPLSNAQNLGYRNSQNPMYALLYNDNRNDMGTVNGSFKVDIDIISDKLKFTTNYNYSLGARNARNVDFDYNNGIQDVNSSISRENLTTFDQVWDNYLTYENSFGDHNLTLVGGYSYRSEYAEVLLANASGLVPSPTFENENLWYIDRAIDFSPTIDNYGDTKDGVTLNGKLYYMSYFGRLAYDYEGKYLLYGTIRRDGNNKFQQTWANYFTAGAGWVISEENFFNVSFVDFLKFRAGWGQLGNDAISPAVGSPTFDAGRITLINGEAVQGQFLNPAYDYIDRPEYAEEINLGITAKAFKSRLSMEFDYFVRNHKKLAASVILPGFRSPVRRNIGEIQNKGLELSLNWSDEISNDWSYNLGGNIATLSNEVKSLGGAESLNAGSADFRQISIVGEPYEAFYGYEIEGVFQNEEQIQNSGYSQEFLDTFDPANPLSPGDFFFKDQNNDGVIDDQDRVVLGSYIPDLTYGFNIGVTYKDFNLTANFQGQSGYSILNRKRGEMKFTNDTNIDAELANNLWRGEGTSNKYPSAAGLRKGWNQNMSSYYIEDGSYFRIQNVRLSYNLVGKEVFGGSFPETRITFTAERPLTLFSYNGFNPEVSNGIDRQVYPIPAVYTIGLNVKL